jgi:hypothetical protein
MVPYGFGQTYTVSTFAGGGLPNNVPAATTGIGATGALAVDTSGNVYCTTGNIILRMDAVTRMLTVVAGRAFRASAAITGRPLPPN